MVLQIKRAERKQRKAKIALMGPSGSGKTMTALRVARGLVGESGRILLGDTERGSSTLYSDRTPFDQTDLPNFEYETFLDLIHQAAALKYDCLVIDSISHAWESFLEMHEQESARQRNSFTAWAKITPKYNQLIAAITQAPLHVIVTMRSKTEYVVEQNQNGKQAPKKVGMAPVMRPGSEYEFDVVGAINLDHQLCIEKSRIDWLADKVVAKADEKLGAKIAEWLSAGKPADAAPAAAPVAPKPEPAPTPAASKPTAFWYRLEGLDDAKIPAAVALLQAAGAIYEHGVYRAPLQLKKLQRFECSDPTVPSEYIDVPERDEETPASVNLESDTPGWMDQEAQAMDDAAAVQKLNEMKNKKVKK